ncbi:MAG TPA: serine hydrolase domain-containing protein [Candidatus Binataceae bacterium]|nr:serine hydrolase domain-containing protein [Candidatus Binataceae bacterium]
MGWREVEQAVNEAVEQGAIPGAAIVVRKGDEIAFEGAFGYRALVPERSPMRLETVFDLSSLTKPLATTIGVMLLTRDGKMRLDERVTRFFHNFGVHGKGYVTFRQLLAHCSGLAAWHPFYQQIAEVERGGKVNFMASRGAKEFVYEEIHREKPESTPGTKANYSDLNFILLGEAVEQVSGVALNRFCRDKIFRPLELRATDFIDISLVRTRRLEPVPEMFAPTSVCVLRKRLLVGEVEDENAFAMGGVAGHAGLFAPVREVDRIAHELMRCYAGRSDFVPQKIVREFWTRDKTVQGSTWALGWDSPSPEYSSSGHHFSPEAVGHLGFTGTSIWIEPAREIAVSILTNRVHPKRDNQAIRDFRPKIHDLVMEALEEGK